MSIEAIMQMTVREAAQEAIERGVLLSTFLVQSGFRSHDELDN